MYLPINVINLAYGQLQISLRYSRINSQFMYSDNLVKCDYNILYQKV